MITANSLFELLVENRRIIESFSDDTDNECITAVVIQNGEWRFWPKGEDYSNPLDDYLDKSLVYDMEQLSKIVNAEIVERAKAGESWRKNEFREFLKTIATDAGYDYVETDAENITYDPR